MTDYVVIYEPADGGGWGAYLPDIDGVVALGDSRAEVEKLIVEALNAYLEYMHEEGKPVPPPRSEAGTVPAATAVTTRPA